MSRSELLTLAIALILLSSTVAFAKEITLFNGKDLEDWTLDTRVERDGQKITKDEVFLVQNGVLICGGGLSLGTLRHEEVFEAEYALSLEWSWGPNLASGTEISIHSSDEQDEVGRRREIQVSLSVDQAGGIVYKATEPWKVDGPSNRRIFIDAQRDRQTDREVEKEMGEWNRLLIICREKKITVLVNGQPVNQVLDAPLSKGAIGLGVAPVPIFYRNVKLIQPLGPEYARAERAAEPLAAAWAKIEARKKAEELKREQERLAAERREELRKQRMLAERNSVIQSLRDAVSKALEQVPEAVPQLNAKALPYPRDARELKFNTTFGMINFKSGSSLQALAAFYLREMGKRGWRENESKAKMEEDSVELFFEANGGEFELELDERSDYVDVSIDTEGVDFAEVNDPASLAALGIPQPRKVLLLQREIAFPPDAQRLSFDDDSCMFYSTMELKEAFAHFGSLIRKKGYRESRRPILSASRNYTEFKRRSVELSVNVFTDQVGSRIILEYDDGKKDPIVPPLPEVPLAKTNPSVASNLGLSDSNRSGAGAAATSAAQIDVASNKGSATVTLDGQRYVFSHVAAFRSKEDIEDDGSTSLVFSKRPIPFSQMQRKLATDDYFSFVDVSSFDMPTYFVVTVGRSSSISLSVPGTGMFHGLKNSMSGTTVEVGRIRGTLKPPSDEEFDDDFSFTATVDAVIMTPYTTLATNRSSAATGEQGDFVDIAPPMPDDAGDLGRTGTKYSKTYTANVRMPLAETAKFYRTTLENQNWQAVEAPAAEANEEVFRYRNSIGTMTVRLESNGSQTDISITKHDDTMAKQDGVMPEPVKGRLILANAHNVRVVFTIGKTNYPVKAGAGAEGFQDALNYTVRPGKYVIRIKIPGQPVKTETLQITKDSTWAIVALPTGGYMPLQLY